MIKTAFVAWVIGLITWVPYLIFDLVFVARPDRYALLITLILLWVFGFWLLLGPIISAVKIRQLFEVLEAGHDHESFRRIVTSSEGEEAAVEQIASRHALPRIFAKRLYRYARKRYATTPQGAM